jgi:hypothetical protein
MVIKALPLPLPLPTSRKEFFPSLAPLLPPRTIPLGGVFLGRVLSGVNGKGKEVVGLRFTSALCFTGHPPPSKKRVFSLCVKKTRSCMELP